MFTPHQYFGEEMEGDINGRGIHVNNKDTPSGTLGHEPKNGESKKSPARKKTSDSGFQRFDNVEVCVKLRDSVCVLY